MRADTNALWELSGSFEPQQSRWREIETEAWPVAARQQYLVWWWCRHGGIPFVVVIDGNEIFPDGEEIPQIAKSMTPGNPVECLQMPVGVLDAHLDQPDELLIPSRDFRIYVAHRGRKRIDAAAGILFVDRDVDALSRRQAR